jgi:hypothetical protein
MSKIFEPMRFIITLIIHVWLIAKTHADKFQEGKKNNCLNFRFMRL